MASVNLSECLALGAWSLDHPANFLSMIGLTGFIEMSSFSEPGTDFSEAQRVGSAKLKQILCHLHDLRDQVGIALTMSRPHLDTGSVRCCGMLARAVFQSWH